MDGLKRKHVTFDEPAPAEMSAAGPSVHPDRARVVPGAAPAAKKAKTVSAKKKRYLLKKNKRYRKMKAAKRAAAPKDKHWDGEDEEESGDSEDSDEEEEEKPTVNVEATKPGPSTATSSVEPKTTTEAEERAMRKAEKAAKRDARREERKAKRRAEREAIKAKEAAQANGTAKNAQDETDDEETAQPEDNVDSDDEEVNGEAEDDIPDLPQRLTRSPSTPPLEPFPLPRMAPAPDAAVLQRQGMPTGLSDATFIPQDLRRSIPDLAAEVAAGAGLSERTQKRLAELGVEDFFAVQAAMLPHLLSLPLVPLPYAPLSDYLISAPTGSGKTLAYAIPIVELLARRVVPRLRALIVLPTRDLVVQVRETLEALAKGTGLMIGSVTGQHSFAQEQAQLVGDAGETLLGGASKLDILIATPGRLMDHLEATPNFTLQHLRFLVIDEADRLLTQSFQNWLARVLAHTRAPVSPSTSTAAAYDAVAPSWSEPLGLASGAFEGAEQVPSTCQKLLFSATLTRDPAKVAALDLSAPQYFIVHSPSNTLGAVSVGQTFALPAELVEKTLILPAALKPLNLIHLIHGAAYAATPALVFAKSVEAATRLVRLLEFFEDAYIGDRHVTVRAYTRDMGAAERKRLLKDFADGKVDVVVCSDLVARGMDLPSVEHVISYDVPLDMTKYVHRAGRTARAGRAGTVWTMVEKQEALHFKAMLKGAGHDKVKKVKVQEDELAGYKASYEIAMQRLKEVYGRE